MYQPDLKVQMIFTELGFPKNKTCSLKALIGNKSPEVLGTDAAPSQVHGKHFSVSRENWTEPLIL